jgi:hypothetical protein
LLHSSQVLLVRSKLECNLPQNFISFYIERDGQNISIYI